MITGPKPLPVTIEGGGQATGQASAPRPTQSRGLADFEKPATAVVRSAGQAAVGLARNDPMPAFDSAVKATTAGLEKLGPAGTSAAAVVRLTSESVKAFRSTVDAFVERGRELEGFSGQLSAANARADVRSTKDDIREAQVIGPKIAELVDKQSAFDSALREAILPIKSFLLDVLNGFMEATRTVFDGMLAGIQGILEVVRELPIVGAMIGKEMLDHVKRIRQKLEGEDQGGDGEDLLSPLLKLVQNLPVGAAIPAPQIPMGGLGVPVVEGAI